MRDAPLLVATRSTHKAREIAELLRPLRVPLVTLDTIGLRATEEEEHIEQFDSFLENARAKAEYFHRLTGLPTLADDSGLAVHTLAGLPGVRSRRYSGRHDLNGTALDQANNDALLAALRDVPAAARTAHYVCAAVLVSPTPPAVLAAIGTVRGCILEHPRGRAGFGYDPLFFLPALNHTFAECDRDTKHALSHRGRALRALAAFLR